MVYHPHIMLVTGGAGFIGSHVLDYMVIHYPDVTFFCLDKLDYCANMKNLNNIISNNNFHFIKGDITSFDLISYLFQKEKIDTVLHFAAQTHVDNSFGNSLHFTYNNVLGTHVLLEAARSSPYLQRFIHVSTDEVYGQNAIDQSKFSETNVLSPSNPYSASKAAAEQLVRSNNVYGPRQYPEKIIPKFINLLIRDMPCPLHGNGLHLRSHIFVDDVVKAYDKILTHGSIGEIYNIGTDYEISNLNLLKLLIKHFNYHDIDQYITFVSDRHYNDMRYRIDISKLIDLDWNVKIMFDEGLDKTIEWYRDNLNYFGDIESAIVPHPRLPFGFNHNISQL